ncbi:MAG TPA: hypothetical protein VG537_00335 [Candidatus Kapabacteria bacterium]|nr:hypothetical protein [Candidatus Kapabacteria bacterium]
MKEWEGSNIQLLLEYRSVRTAVELTTELQRLTESVPKLGVPILHLTMHGDEDGLQLSSGECIDWTELSPFIVNLNIATRNNLLITLAACFGLYLGAVNAKNWDRSAYWCVLGRLDPHSAGDFTNDYIRFYRNLIESSNFGDAIRAINNNGEKHYRIYSGLALFLNASEGAIGGWITNDEERIIFKKAKKKFRNAGNPIPHKVLKRRVTEAFIGKLLEWRIKFFMIDLFPENESRFVEESRLRKMISTAIQNKKINNIGRRQASVLVEPIDWDFLDS